MKQKFKPVKINTERLTMRPHQVGDEVLLNEAILSSFKELHTWTDWAKTPQTLAETEAYVDYAVQCWQAEAPSELPMLIFNQDETELLGATGYTAIHSDIPMLEIGYWVNTAHAGKGYITEAVNVLTRFAFSEWKAKRIEIRCDPDNVRSTAVPKRLGYMLEAHFKNHRIQPVTHKLSGTLVFVRYDAQDLVAINYRVNY